MLKHLFNITLCILLSYVLVACHLDGKKKAPPASPPVISPPATPPPKKPSLTWSGAIDLTNAKKYQDLLGSYRKCVHSSFCTWYEGPAKCSNFSRGDISIKFAKSDLPAKVTVEIKEFYTGSQALPLQFWFGVCSYPVNYQVPITLNGTAKYFNDYQGFHVRLEGVSGISGGITITSTDSVPEAHGVLSVNIYYGGSATTASKFGTAELENPDMEDLYPSQTGGR